MRDRIQGVSPDRVSVVISTYRQPRELDACFAALAEGSALPGEIAVADDGSGEETAGVIRAWADRLPVPILHAWHPDQGFWRTRAGNLAITRCTLDYVVLLDCDCMASPRFLEDHAHLAEAGTFVQGRRATIRQEYVDEYLTERPSFWTMALVGKVKNRKHGVRLPRPVVHRDHGLKRTIACNLGIWREDLVAVNGWNEEFRNYGSEDWELVARLYNLGRTRKLVRGWAAVYHLGHPQGDPHPPHETLHQAILRETVESGRVRCPEGLDLHLEGSR